MHRIAFVCIGAVLLGVLFRTSQAVSQSAPAASQPRAAATTRPDADALRRTFKESLTGVTLTGTWRMHRGPRPVDRPTLGEARPETYRIVSADHEDGDRWIIRARIQFDEADVTLPLRVRVVWADDTPVITVDELNVPGIGVYSARVMIYRGYYCGTWFGTGYGGVMSGEIVRAAEDGDQPPAGDGGS